MEKSLCFNLCLTWTHVCVPFPLFSKSLQFKFLKNENPQNGFLGKIREFERNPIYFKRKLSIPILNSSASAAHPIKIPMISKPFVLNFSKIKKSVLIGTLYLNLNTILRSYFSKYVLTFGSLSLLSAELVHV